MLCCFFPVCLQLEAFMEFILNLYCSLIAEQAGRIPMKDKKASGRALREKHPRVGLSASSCR